MQRGVDQSQADICNRKRRLENLREKQAPCAAQAPRSRAMRSAAAWLVSASCLGWGHALQCGPARHTVRRRTCVAGQMGTSLELTAEDIANFQWPRVCPAYVLSRVACAACAKLSRDARGLVAGRARSWCPRAPKRHFAASVFRFARKKNEGFLDCDGVF